MNWIYKIVIVVIILIIIYQLSIRIYRAFAIRSSKRLLKKYQVLVNTINNAVFKGNGIIVLHSDNGFFIYQDRDNQILRFEFISDQLAVTWKPNWSPKELHKIQVENIDNLDDKVLEKKGQEIVSEMELIIEKHRTHILKNAK